MRRIPSYLDEDFLIPTAIIALVGLIVGFMALPADPDLWFHLAGGQQILATGAVPDTDPFSFTRNGDLWVPHSWLFDVFVAATWQTLGPRASEAIFALLFMGTILIALQLLAARGVHPFAALVICAALAIAAGNTRGLRPQVVSLFFATITIATLVRHRHWPDRRALWLLPLVFLVWAQVHAACVMGLALIVVWTCGRLLETVLQQCWPESRNELATLGWTTVLVAAVILITPHALDHYSYVLLTMKLDFLKERVAEWQAPAALALRSPDIFLYVLLVGVLILLGRRGKQVGFAELGLAGAVLVLACSGTRHIPLACVATIPLLAELLGERPRGIKVRCASSWRPLFGISALGAILLAVMWSFPSGVWTRYAQAEPLRGAAALAEQRGPLRVFTTYNTGSYVLFRAPGRLKVFVDSRADVYDDPILFMADAMARGDSWERLFDAWEIDAAVVARSDGIAPRLGRSAEWTLLAEDPRTLTYLRADLAADALATR